MVRKVYLVMQSSVYATATSDGYCFPAAVIKVFSTEKKALAFSNMRHHTVGDHFVVTHYVE